MKITFLHPDLGIGGAERLVVDAALALRSRGHEIRIVTNHFSRDHCFDDLLSFEVTISRGVYVDFSIVDFIFPQISDYWYAKQGIFVLSKQCKAYFSVCSGHEKIADITVIGGFPRSFFGKFNALCAYIRICIAAVYICLTHDPDVIFCDLISAPLIILSCFSKAKRFFYCHYPDQLLTARKSFGKRIYRFFIDWIESYTTGFADVIFVNSRYTESVFRSVFSSLSSRKLEVLYPSLNTRFFDQQQEKSKEDDVANFSGISKDYKHVFLSLNRFEVKKNIELAIRAFALLKDRLPEDIFSKCLLVLAGGYDVLNNENITYHKYLQQVVKELEVEQAVVFILSPGDETKVQLLRRCQIVVYTPENEHFGIVPLEAMYLSRPVLATNSGGPRETVVNEETGFLCDNTPSEFCDAMLQAVECPEKIQRMGINGHKRVLENFSFGAFTDKLDHIVCERS